MADWRGTGQSYTVLLWQETAEDPVTEEEAEIQREWLFKSEEEAVAFVGEQVGETVRLNEEHIPPAVVRSIREDLAQGRVWDGAVPKYLEAMDEYLGSEEWIHIGEAELMERA